MRYFLGVHRFAPTLALLGDTGWIPSVYRRWTCMLRFWNRLILMDNDRLTKKVFIYDYNLCTNNWTSEIKQVMCKLGLTDHFDNKSIVNMSYVKHLMTDYYGNAWSRDIQNVPKLRSYKLYKTHLIASNMFPPI